MPNPDGYYNDDQPSTLVAIIGFGSIAIAIILVILSLLGITKSSETSSDDCSVYYTLDGPESDC